MRLELLKQLLTVPSPSRREETMVAFLKEHVRRRGASRCGELVTDEFNNVCIRKGQPGTVPVVAAHLDNVQAASPVKIIQQTGRLYGVDENGERTGVGADDKAGVFVCLELLERFANIAVILFASEEVGGVGAQNAPAEWFKDAGYLIEFDCPGRGLVSYTSGNERLFANDGEFIETAAPVMRAHGLTHWQQHPFSDVMVLRRRFPISCLNLSCGYYNWHQPDEFIVIEEVEAAVNAGEALIVALGDRAYPYEVGVADLAKPIFEVTGLQVSRPPEPKQMAMREPGTTAPVKTTPSEAATRIPDAPSGDLEPLADPDDAPSLWNRYLPSEEPFFKMAMLDQLLRHPYHTVSLEGPFKLKQLVEDQRGHTFRSETVIDRSGNSNTYRLLLRLPGDVFGYFEDEILKIYAPTAEVAQATAQQFRPYVKPSPQNKPYHYVISIENGGANAQKVYIDRPLPVSTEELALHYGVDFPAWELEWRARLSRVTSGLTIFHGEPGCGKTYFLRALSGRLLDKAVFYIVPLSEVELLSNPSFVTFWMEQTKRHQKKIKIVILEDAEELLLPRDRGNRNNVSNLLNIADGFLGDYLKLHVVATTNAPVRELDKAVLRPGRLIGQRQFRRLTRAEAERLAQAKGLTLPEQSDYSLAEVYNGAAVGPELNGQRRVGFAS
jgi:hypothetical protein